MSLSSFAAAHLLRVLPRERISHAVGKLCELPLPPLVSDLTSRIYAGAFGVDMKDAAVPHGSYRSFDAFFTRRLRAGSRPIEDASIISPCDGRISAQGPIDEGARILVKGQRYEVAELLGSAVEAGKVIGGHFSVIYLSPRDYHRVHAPVDGTLMHVRAIEGSLFPVNALGERSVPHLFVKNRRVVLRFALDQSPHELFMVMVGAMIVGKISINALGDEDVPEGEHAIAKRTVRRGDEVGAFHLGSTVVLFVPPPLTLDAHSGPILLGQSLSSAS